MQADAGPAAVFAALGDPVRLVLLERLSRGPGASITTLTASATISRQAITKHLRVLERAGLVHRQRAGREVLYAFRGEPMAAAEAYLNWVGARWDAALGRLKTHLGE